MAVAIPWESRFSVGHDVLDRQHRKLLGLCNDLLACENEAPDVAMMRCHDILHQLSVYAREHFQTEEKILRDAGYADLAEQIADHGAYEETIADWAFEASMDSLNSDMVRHYVMGWWQEHILVSDMRYKAVLEGRR